MGAVQAYSVNDGPLGGDLDLLHPGEAFDLPGLADTFAGLKVKENQNGRLAMSSGFGYYMRANVTGGSLVEQWASHTVNPFTVSG